MNRVFYCYSCGEYFYVKNSLRLTDEGEVCSLCGSDDTEFCPEEMASDQDIIDDDNYHSYDDNDDNDDF